jgi:hypothetical protein
MTAPLKKARLRERSIVLLFVLLFALTMAGFTGHAQAADDAAARCAALTALDLGPSKVTKAEILSGETAARVGLDQQALARQLIDLPAFCRAVVFTSGGQDSAINTEVWLPVANWNGRFLGKGNGGFAGRLSYGALADGLRRGFAVGHTDMGTGPKTDGSGAIGHPVKWYDFGWRSTHSMTVAGKAIAEKFYAAAPTYSYFQGCSTGGYQGLRLAQFFPDDYDGILSGNAGNRRAAKIIAQTYYGMQVKLNQAGKLSVAKLMAMHKDVLKQCAGVGGGLKDDPFLANPYACDWKPERLACKGAETDSCLTPAQLKLANIFYSPIVLKSTGETIWPGRPPGAELGWAFDGRGGELMNVPEAGDPPHAAVIRSILGENHDFRKSDWDRDVDTFIKIQGMLLGDGKNTDLSAFQKSGGKLLSTFGWSDGSTSYDMTGYYDAVEADLKRRTGASDEQAASEIRGFTRLFMAPGMGHCGGGNGPNVFDALSPLMKWVEEGTAPERIIAAWKPSPVGTPVPFTASLARAMTRPLCVYPLVAHYDGSGSKDDAASFTCRR